jgi:hypothetical protein
MTKTKYNSKKVVIDNINFSSKLEARFYVFLKDLVENLELQIPFELQPKYKLGKKTIRPISYVADFKFRFKGLTYVIDSKGMETPVYKIKYKMLMYKYPNLNFYAVSSIKKLKEILDL